MRCMKMQEHCGAGDGEARKRTIQRLEMMPLEQAQDELLYTADPRYDRLMTVPVKLEFPKKNK
jgi:hypothetical protein